MKTSFGLTLVLALSGCALAPVESGAAGDFRQALTPVFQADMPTALARLAALTDRELDAKQQQVRACMLARFGGGAQDTGPQAPDGAAGQVLNAYRRYWTAVLMRTATPEQAESGLSADLAPWSAAGSKGLDAQEESVSGLLKAQGLFVLGGMTPPLRELMVWRRQTSQAQGVELPGGRIEVKVTLLDDFVSLGWAAWATCDKSHTGGWATEDGIMVVAPAWDRDSEPYRVSLLAHEAQHFSDYRRYPKLSPADLEYRAKLVEIAMADKTQASLLNGFSAGAARDRALPHPFADYWLVTRLRARLGTEDWKNASVNALREAALGELAAHGAALDERGRETVTTALPD